MRSLSSACGQRSIDPSIKYTGRDAPHRLTREISPRYAADVSRRDIAEIHRRVEWRGSSPGAISSRPRRDLGGISAVSRRYLGGISAVSRHALEPRFLRVVVPRVANGAEEVGDCLPLYHLMRSLKISDLINEQIVPRKSDIAFRSIT